METTVADIVKIVNEQPIPRNRVNTIIDFGQQVTVGESSPSWGYISCFLYGMIEGKRAERARRRGEGSVGA